MSIATCCFSLEAGPHEIARKLEGAKASEVVWVFWTGSIVNL